MPRQHETPTAESYAPTERQLSATYRYYLAIGLPPAQAAMALLYAAGMPPIKAWNDPSAPTAQASQ
jgi:hypothetical protein